MKDELVRPTRFSFSSFIVHPSALLLLFLAAVAIFGCSKLRSTELPTRNHLMLDQLVVYSDDPLPAQNRLLEQLRVQRSHLTAKLELPVSEEPIYVYLFPKAERLDAFMKVHYPAIPSRRAYFIESDTRLAVYAYWGDRVAEDLRHEVAHGYLHAVVPHLPLWLDEGLAEYFEVPLGQEGLNRPHVELLASELRKNWRPDLARLEQLRAADDMSQREYAESWAWVHMMLETTPQRGEVLRGYLHSLGRSTPPFPISEQLAGIEPDASARLIDYVAKLAASLR